MTALFPHAAETSSGGEPSQGLQRDILSDLCSCNANPPAENSNSDSFRGTQNNAEVTLVSFMLTSGVPSARDTIQGGNCGILAYELVGKIVADSESAKSGRRWRRITHPSHIGKRQVD